MYEKRVYVRHSRAPQKGVFDHLLTTLRHLRGSEDDAEPMERAKHSSGVRRTAEGDLSYSTRTSTYRLCTLGRYE